MRQRTNADKVHARFRVSADVLKHDAAAGLDRNPPFCLPLGCLLDAFNGVLDFLHRHVVQQDGLGAISDRFFQLLRRAHFNLHPLTALALFQSTLKHRRQAAAERNVIVLDQDAGGQIDAMVCSSSTLHGVLFKNPQSRNGLACVEYLCMRSLNCVNVCARQRGNPAQVLHKIQDHSLATEQRAGIVADHGQHLPRAHADAVKNLRMAYNFKARMRWRPRVEPRKDIEYPFHRAQPGHHQLLARDNRRRGAHIRVDGQVGCGVGHGPIFHQGLLQQCVDAASLPIHVTYNSRVRFAVALKGHGFTAC